MRLPEITFKNWDEFDAERGGGGSGRTALDLKPGDHVAGHSFQNARHGFVRADAMRTHTVVGHPVRTTGSLPEATLGDKPPMVQPGTHVNVHTVDDLGAEHHYEVLPSDQMHVVVPSPPDDLPAGSW